MIIRQSGSRHSYALREESKSNQEDNKIIIFIDNEYFISGDYFLLIVSISLFILLAFSETDAKEEQFGNKIIAVELPVPEGAN